MASFRIVPASGWSSQEWSDPERAPRTLPSDPGQPYFNRLDPGAPSRVNPRSGIPQRRRQCLVGQPAVLQALKFTDFVLWYDDFSLDGRTYSWWWVERPGIDDPAVCYPNLVSVVNESPSVTFTPLTAGHYLIGCRRPQEGIAMFHFDAM